MLDRQEKRGNTENKQPGKKLTRSTKKSFQMNRGTQSLSLPLSTNNSYSSLFFSSFISSLFVKVFRYITISLTAFFLCIYLSRILSSFPLMNLLHSSFSGFFFFSFSTFYFSRLFILFFKSNYIYLSIHHVLLPVSLQSLSMMSIPLFFLSLISLSSILPFV